MSVVYDINQIMKILPHRYPFLLVDKVTEIEGDSITAIKNVTMNEPFFQGHFPGKPIMPGVLMIEALAQVGGILAHHQINPAEGTPLVVFFMSVNDVKFRQPVVPGDTLEMKVTLLKKKRDIWSFQGEAFVDGKLVCQGNLMAMAKVEE